MNSRELSVVFPRSFFTNFSVHLKSYVRLAGDHHPPSGPLRNMFMVSKSAHFVPAPWTQFCSAITTNQSIKICSTQLSEFKMKL